MGAVVEYDALAEKRRAVTAWLQDVAAIVRATEALRDAVERARMCSEPGAVRYRDAPGSPNAGRGPVESGALEAVYREQALAAWEDSTAAELQRARTICEKMPAAVMWAKVVERLTVRELASRFHTSRPTVYALLDAAVVEIHEQMPPVWRV